MKKITIVALMVVLIVGCSTIEHSSNVLQPIGKNLIVGVGDIVLRVNKQRSLENAFGKADLFGRKTNEGFSELRFAGVEKTGEVVLYRNDVRIISNETTMSRTPISTTSASANTTVTGNYYGGGTYGTITANGQTNYTSTTLTPASDFHVVVPAETIPIRLAVGETKVPMEGHVVEIIRATNSLLEYRVKKY